MKKIFSLITAVLLIFSLTACDKTKQINMPDTAETELQFVLGTPLTKEKEYTAEDGTVLMTEKYELPQLELHTADGKICNPEEASKSSDEGYRNKAKICRAFNDEMQRAAEQVEAAAQERLETARENYADLDEKQRKDWMCYAEELTIGQTYQTDGLLSILGNGYTDGGGAHPSTYTGVWNFDLAEGKFITFDSLTGDDNPLGSILYSTFTSAIFDAIEQQGLGDGYLDDYESYVSDLSANANFYFTDSGMTIVFDVYVLAPYAAGPQAFIIPYDEFYYALSEHMQSLFKLPADTVVISDYRRAREFWSWLNMSMAPVDEGASEITTKDGVSRCEVSLGNVKTMDDLKKMLSGCVSEEIAEEWLSKGNFAEVNGALYISYGERGSDISPTATEEYSVNVEGNKGELTRTVYAQAFDKKTGTYISNGKTDAYVYPFNLKNGHAVFTAFPCPY